MAVMLDVKNINVYYGAIHAVKDISFQVNEGEIVTLIGANGVEQTGHGLQCGGLARAVGTDEGDNLPLVDLKGDCHPHRRQRRGQDYHTANRVRSAPHPHRLH